jgi:hypothetical protein
MRDWTDIARHARRCANQCRDEGHHGIAVGFDEIVRMLADGRAEGVDPRNLRPVAWEHQCVGGRNVLSYIKKDERIENVQRVRPLLYSDPEPPTAATTDAGREDAELVHVGWKRAWEAVAAALSEVSPGWDTPDGTCDMDRAVAAIRKLTPAGGEDGRDGARYRWIRDEAARFKGGDDPGRLRVSITMLQRRDDGEGFTGLAKTPRGADFDAAIDVAIAAERGAGEG